MKTLKTDQRLLTLKGEVLKEDNTEITVGLILSNILSNSSVNPHRSYQLAKAIATNDTVELKAEDILFIREALNRQNHLGSLYTGQIIEVLESL